MNFIPSPRLSLLRAVALGFAALAAFPAARADIPLAGPSAPPLVALFETRIQPKEKGSKPQTSRWYFFREAERVEIRDEHGRGGELWERDPSGKMFYSRLLHDDRAQIEFAPTEFQVAGRTWDRVSSLVDRGALGKTLQHEGHGRRIGTQMERFAGTADGRRVAVLWDNELALPAEIRGSNPHRSTIVRLMRTWAPGQAPVSMTGEKTLAVYRQIDGADLGDMESDPLVVRVLGQGAAHQH
jgi:hypothetical protein